MSQLNLKQILSGDNLSTVVEKLNYNFNQILLNGGGPKGLRGLLGAPGLPGSQGIQGLDGPKGETGTQLYTAAGATPGSYQFGAGGEILPRTGDVFISAVPTSITIWELSPTGTSNFWNLVETILPPTTGSKLIYDAVQFNDETFTSFTNDPDISGKLLIGSTDALTNNFAIDPGFPNRLRQELSSAAPFGDSLSTFVSDRNQIRILNSSNNVNTISSTSGGVVHSLQTLGGNSVYKIVHGDSIGNKHFSVKLNGGATSLPSLFYANTDNRLGVGVPEFTPLIATAVINGGLAVGSAANSFYLSSNGANLQNSLGAIIEGNVSIGRNKNNFATLGVYSRPNVANNSSIVIDSNLVSTSSVSSLTIGGGLYNDNVASTSNGYSWSFRTISQTNIASYRDLRLDATVPGSARTAISVRAPNNNDRVKVGVDNTDPYGLLEIGPQESTFSRVSIGDIPLDASGNTEDLRSYIGFNWHRNPSQLAGVPWRRYGSPTTELEVSRSGAAIWNSANGLGISIRGGTPGNSITNNDTLFINSHAFFIDYDKNVGINTLTPQSKLDIDVGTSNTSLSNGNSILRLSGGNPTYQGFFAINGTSFQIGQNSDNRSLTLHSGSGMPEHMRIQSNGDVGVGITSPSQRLDVNGNIRVRNLLTTQGNGFVSVDSTGVMRRRTFAETLTDIGAQAALTNPVTGTGSNGRVSIWNGTTTQYGNANLFWDNSESRLGVGTASPSQRLHVNGVTRTTSLTVGSNTAPPANGLRVAGQTRTNSLHVGLNIENAYHSFINEGGSDLRGGLFMNVGFNNSAWRASRQKPGLGLIYQEATNVTPEEMNKWVLYVNPSAAPGTAVTFRPTLRIDPSVSTPRLEVLYGIDARGSSDLGLTKIEVDDSNNYAARIYNNISWSPTTSHGGLYIRVQNNSAQNHPLIIQRVVNSTATNLFRVRANGTVFSGGAVVPSDIRLKRDISKTEKSLEKILKLNPVTYKWKDQGTDKLNYGFIAQEVMEIYPDTVELDNFFDNPDDNMYHLNYENLISELTKAIQEQQLMIEDLKKRVEDLES